MARIRVFKFDDGAHQVLVQKTRHGEGVARMTSTKGRSDTKKAVEKLMAEFVAESTQSRRAGAPD